MTKCKDVDIFGESQLKIKDVQKTSIDFDAPFELFKKIYTHYPSNFLLESMESDSGLSRFSVLGFDPVATLKAEDGLLKVEFEGSDIEIETDNPFNQIKDIIKIGNGKKGFQGGLVGYVSYESVRYFEPMEMNLGSTPDYEFGLFLDAIIFDRLRNKCEYVTLGENRLSEIKEVSMEEHESATQDIGNREIDNDLNLGNDLIFQELRHHFSQEKFESMVSSAKKRILDGEIFQSVISNAREYKISGNKLSFYESLRNINPSPYMYHLKLGEREIIGSSPEMLVRVEGRHIETYPIAGTRKRGKNTAEDNKLEKELLADEKERAEHLMLVDLARNDIGKVSEFGTVQVPEFMTVRKFSHVQHIVSRVEGKLSGDKNAVDAFSSIFPAGTVSGAPKFRAMEIINELEGIPRGPYAGAVGYFALNGNADFAITIRTLVCEGNHAKIQAGAGIVHDSVPTSEYYECENKAQALLSALNMAGEVK